LTQKWAERLSGWYFPHEKQYTGLGSSGGSALHVKDTKLGWEDEWLSPPALIKRKGLGSSVGSAVHVTDTKLCWEAEWLALPAFKTMNGAGKFSL